MGCQVCGTTLIALPTLPALSGRGMLASPALLAVAAAAMVLGLHPTVSNFGLGLAVSWNAGVVAFFLPAGLGVREAGLVVLMGAAFAPGFPPTLALAARLWILVGDLAPFAIAGALRPLPGGKANSAAA